jgi:tRNA pseudouridine38-40 synthase
VREVTGRDKLEVYGSGRTDAGVHALAQVAHFDTTAERPLAAWVRGTNTLLPSALAVTWSLAVSGEFHARYSALGRVYRYVLLNRGVRPASDYGRVGWFHAPLNAGAMRAAGECLLGEHDFSAFRAADCQARTPVRTVHRLDVSRRGDVVIFEIHANAFLHHMVRNIVGSLVYVGKGKHPPEWLAKVLASRDRTQAAPTFEASGLYLAGVEYEPHWGLPSAPRRTLVEMGNGI